LDENKKGKQAGQESLPEGLQEIAALPSEKPALIAPSEAQKEHLLLEEAQGGQKAEEHAQRPRTQKEQELDALIASRQSIIEQLKAKNPQLGEARREVAELIPSIRGKGSGRAMELVREEERIEFSIATEAYTPKKEKELLKRLREIRTELSQHKELDAARKKVDEKRAAMRTLVSEIRELERKLSEARAACDAKYAEVLAERKEAFAQRQRGREQKRHEQQETRRRFKQTERKREYDDEMSKYMKEYDDTVSMDEIVQIERKEKKGKKEDKEG
jgi:uncharacterized coiled-coil DUF342 family protein